MQTKNVRRAVSCALALLLAGCAPQLCLSPLYTASDKGFDERLLGQWRFVDPDEPEKEAEEGALILSRLDGETPAYKVVMPGKKGKEGEKEEPGLISQARLVALGESTFLDFETPDENSLDSKLAPYPLLRAHAIARLRLEKDSLRMDFLSDDWLKQQIKDGKPALPAVHTEDGYVVTASTEELRKFAPAHAQDDNAFSERFLLKRMK